MFRVIRLLSYSCQLQTCLCVVINLGNYFVEQSWQEWLKSKPEWYRMPRRQSWQNSLAAGVEQVSDDVELTAESLHRPRSDRRSCTWWAQQVKREKKSGQSSRLFGEKGEEMGMDARSRRGITKIQQIVQNQMRIQRRGLRSWSVGHVHWSSPVLGCRFPTRLWAWILR